MVAILDPEDFLLSEEGTLNNVNVQHGGHVKYVFVSFSELREPILTSSSAK